MTSPHRPLAFFVRFDDPADRELLHLIPFLEIVSRAPDVRTVVKEKFRMRERVNRS